MDPQAVQVAGTVLMSSHLMRELALTAERFVIVGRGRLIADMSGSDLTAMTDPASVRVRSPHASQFREVVDYHGAPITSEDGTIYDPAGNSLFGATIAQLVLGVMGALMRHTATAIGILVATLFVLPTLFETLGGVWGRASEYLPGEAGEAMISVVRESGDMSPGIALLVLIGWIGALLAAGTIALKRRTREDRRPAMRPQRTVRRGVCLV